jgi:hypothetical protein
MISTVANSRPLGSAHMSTRLAQGRDSAYMRNIHGRISRLYAKNSGRSRRSCGLSVQASKVGFRTTAPWQ